MQFEQQPYSLPMHSLIILNACTQLLFFLFLSLNCNGSFPLEEALASQPYKADGGLPRDAVD